MTSIYPARDRTDWITRQRPPRNVLDPLKPHGFFLEQEPDGSGRVVSSAAILLTNKECPWRCLMCDLWKDTLLQTVPPGAIPAQIDHALAQLGSRPEQIKLYNSGSFFDPAAIPPEDYRAIAEGVAFAGRVIVESHPRLVGSRALAFRDLLGGSLEVALGLETAQPEVLERLNKKFDLTHFAAAADFLRTNGIDLRAFVLVNPPFLDAAAGLEWAVKSAEFAFSCGATVVSLIPTRSGNGAMDRLAQAGEFTAPTLTNLEQAFEASLNAARGRVFADTWNLEEFSRCSACFAGRSLRLRAMNLKQQILPPIRCPACGGR